MVTSRAARRVPATVTLAFTLIAALIATLIATVVTAPARPVTAGEPFYRGPVFAIGDSVMMGARTCIEPRRYRVDALGSRQIAAGTEVLRTRVDRLPQRVVVHLGTNGGAYPEDFDRIVRILGRERTIVFVTIQLPNDYSRYTFEERTNAAIRALPERHPNVRVFDWNAASNTRPGWFWADGFHVRPEGCAAYARLLDRVVRSRP